MFVAPEGDVAIEINSFVAGTPVLMANGSHKPIEDVHAGENVLAGDGDIIKNTPEAVNHVIVGAGLKHLYDVRVDGETVEATYNHPFWVANKSAFEWAQDLKPGDALLLPDGTTRPVEGVTHHDAFQTVYNLSINRVHTFYVGAEGLLVHNSCYDSYKAFKSAMGGAGDDQQWHDIVEQNQLSKSGFKATQINSDENIMGLQTDVHQKVSGYYSSKQGFTNQQGVRDWLAGQSYEQQYQFGVNYLRSIGVNI
jgi:hypothetical protein